MSDVSTLKRALQVLEREAHDPPLDAIPEHILNVLGVVGRPTGRAGAQPHGQPGGCLLLVGVLAEVDVSAVIAADLGEDEGDAWVLPLGDHGKRAHPD